MNEAAKKEIGTIINSNNTNWWWCWSSVLAHEDREPRFDSRGTNFHSYLCFSALVHGDTYLVYVVFFLSPLQLSLSSSYTACSLTHTFFLPPYSPLDLLSRQILHVSVTYHKAIGQSRTRDH